MTPTQRTYPLSKINAAYNTPATPKSPETSPEDSALIAVCAEIIALQHQIDAAYPRGGTIADEQALDAAIEPLAQKRDELTARASQMQAVSPAGMAARAQAIQARFGDELSRYDEFSMTVAALARDAISISGGDTVQIAREVL